jgi:hypothetical protein
MLIDIHQHAWTTPLLDALAERDRLPFVRRTPDGLTVLHSAGKPSLARGCAGVSASAGAIADGSGLETLLPERGSAQMQAESLTFCDTSSVGPRMVETIARWVRPDRLIYGSDGALLEPLRTGREVEVMTNAEVVLAEVGVLA